MPDGSARGSTLVAVLAEPKRLGATRELLGAAAVLAGQVGGRVCVVVPSPLVAPATLGAWGADEVVEMRGGSLAGDVAAALAGWVELRVPWALLAPASSWGREVAARLAAHRGEGLVGDAVGVGVDPGSGRMVSWKPAFGGSFLASITSSSPTQMATVVPGFLPVLAPRRSQPPGLGSLQVQSTDRVRLLRVEHADDPGALAAARIVIGVGMGVVPGEYPTMCELAAALGAELAATRKVTDRGWLPRSRQVGVTGRSISPALYLAVGLSGKPNHMIGVRGARAVLAVNSDPDAAVFAWSDAGIVAGWREALPPLVSALVGLAGSVQSRPG